MRLGITLSDHTLTNIMNRDELQKSFINWDLNQMTLEDLKEFFINTQNAELDCLDDDELVKEVQHYAPQLIVS